MYDLLKVVQDAPFQNDKKGEDPFVDLNRTSLDIV